uniref:Uncharacterized protein n=1 Tax=Salix viminalis TaxID=40686 RepID=A0A6N2K081_SALVM
MVKQQIPLHQVHRVEKLEIFLRLLPVWAAGILLVTANSQWQLQYSAGWTMKRHRSQLRPPLRAKSCRHDIPTENGHRPNLQYSHCNCFCMHLLRKRGTVVENHNLLENPNATVPASVVPQLSLQGISEIFVSVSLCTITRKQETQCLGVKQLDNAITHYMHYKKWTPYLTA